MTDEPKFKTYTQNITNLSSAAVYDIASRLIASSRVSTGFSCNGSATMYSAVQLIYNEFSNAWVDAVSEPRHKINQITNLGSYLIYSVPCSEHSPNKELTLCNCYSISRFVTSKDGNHIVHVGKVQLVLDRLFDRIGPRVREIFGEAFERLELKLGLGGHVGVGRRVALEKPATPQVISGAIDSLRNLKSAETIGIELVKIAVLIERFKTFDAEECTGNGNLEIDRVLLREAPNCVKWLIAASAKAPCLKYEPDPNRIWNDGITMYHPFKKPQYRAEIEVTERDFEEFGFSAVFNQILEELHDEELPKAVESMERYKALIDDLVPMFEAALPSAMLAMIGNLEKSMNNALMMIQSMLQSAQIPMPQLSGTPGQGPFLTLYQQSLFNHGSVVIPQVSSVYG